MRDGLVARDGEGALQGAGGADDYGGHACTSVAREGGGKGNPRFHNRAMKGCGTRLLKDLIDLWANSPAVH